jgi:F0F1-type ATP synthase epsilon subunit
MQIFSAQVRDGVIVLEHGVTLSEGTTVTVIADEAEDPFELTAAEEAELAEAIAEVERGDVLTAAELLRRLSR